MPGASVVLKDQQDNILKGTATAGDGSFELLAKTGNYVLEISFISYENLRIPLTISARENKNLGQITLKRSENTLNEVTVQTDAKLMSFEQDKRVYNVAKDITNVGSNAALILDNIPSVEVDIDGNVSLRGSQNVRILVDGKPSGLIGVDPANALRQFQGDLIERIEVITNPGARYDAEGEAGIINIVLKKKRDNGLNGTFEVRTGYPDNHGGSASINYRSGKWNLFGSAGINYRKNPGSGFSEQRGFGDTTYFFRRDREHTRGGLSQNLRFGADYDMGNKQALTGSFLYRGGDQDNEALLTYTDYDGNGNFVRQIERLDLENETDKTLEGDIHYEKLFDTKKHKWTIDVKYQDSDDRERSNIQEDTLGSPQSLIQRVSNVEDEQNLLFQTDYVKPVGKDGQWEMGLKANLREIINNYSVSQQDENGDFFFLEDFTNDFNYTENIYAAYLIYGNKWGDKVSYQFGVRGEHSDIRTQLLEQPTPNTKEYGNLFPSAFFTWEINSLNDLQWSYSRRISRPSFRSLLPFFGFSDNRNFFSGNPDINPEYTDSYELGHLRYWENATLYTGLYYRHRTGIVERVIQVDENGFTRIFPVNLSVQDAVGLELNYNHDIYKWWKVSASTNIYRSVTTGSFNGLDLGATNFTSQGNLTSRLEFWETNWQTSLRYRGPRNTGQGTQDPIYIVNVGVSKDILKGNGTLAFNVRDLFNSRRRRGTSFGENFENYSEFQWRARQMTLSFTYRLNQKKRSGRPSGGNRGGDEMDM